MPTTPNLGLERPVNGSFVGTWDVPVNGNWDLLDSVAGAVANVGLTNLPVTLSPAQYNTNLINFTGTLTGNVDVTFPSSVGRCYILSNNCVANTTFYVRAWISSAAQYIALPPNEPITVVADGTNMRFMGFDRIGSYWDFAGSAVPIWVTNSNPVPYLNCDGTAFSSATYPALRDYLGVATLPDARGRFRATLNQGTALLTGSSVSGGLDGNTFLASGGSQSIGVANMPSHAHGGIMGPGSGFVGTTFAVGRGEPGYGDNTLSQNTATAGSGTAYAPPSYVGGLTLIRAG